MTILKEIFFFYDYVIRNSPASILGVVFVFVFFFPSYTKAFAF